MKCKYCKANIAATDKKCPKCKKPVAQTENKGTKRKIIMISSIAVLASLGIVLLVAMLGGWDLGSWFREKENNVYYKKDYSVSDRKARKKQDEVVATVGDTQLTNAMLQIYYWRQVYDFRDTYGSSLSYFGLDISKDLADQTYLDGTTTWQQYFLTSALEMWQTNQAFADLAQKNGYVLPETYRDFLDNVDQHLRDTATQSGFGSVEEMLQKEVGAGCTVEDYAEYLNVYYHGYLYFREMFEALEPSADEVEAYYQEHKDEYTKAGVTKDGSVYVDIRHIMLYPENGQMYADGNVYYSQEDWENCLGQVEALLASWKAGEGTEESFAELVKAYSQDDSTKNNGGLYSDTVKGDMMDAIDSWSFDSARQTGDTTIIKSDYGYHIIYFVEAEEIWYAEARTDLQESLGQEMVDEILKEYTLEVDFKKIVLGKVDISA